MSANCVVKKAMNHVVFPISSMWNVRNDMEDPIRVYEQFRLLKQPAKHGCGREV